MQETRCIGLIGGLGPAATVHYYHALLAAAQQSGLALRLMINQANIDLVLQAALDGNTDVMAVHLAERVFELQRAGAEVIAIGAVTPHMCVPKLGALVHVRLVDIVDLTAREVARLGLHKIALIGNRASVGSALFGRLGAEVVNTQPGLIEEGHALYSDIVNNGHVTAITAASLRRLAQICIEDHGAQAVVLAGTELALVHADTWKDLPIIDCAALHMAAIMAQACPSTEAFHTNSR